MNIVEASAKARQSFTDDFRRLFIPSKAWWFQHGALLAKILFGAVLLFPLVNRLPMLGWDWAYFFYAYNPAYNIYSPTSAYPPYTKYVIQLFTRLNWRDSLALLNGISMLTIAIAAWQPRRKYLPIVLALINPCTLILLWIGHPDGLALLGVITGFVPFTLLKPQITAWSLLKSRKSIFWGAVFLLLTFMVWGFWPLHLSTATLGHETAFGWAVTGWPVAILGLVFLAGAGQNTYRLMAAGALLSPYLMPYHLAVLTPAIGSLKPVRGILLWLSSWLVYIGTGLGRPAIAINLVFPVLVYVLSISWDEYRANVRALWNLIRHPLERLK